MDNDLDTLYTRWHRATGELKWGVQMVFKDVLQAAQEEKTTLVYGADYRDGGACLVNTVGVMLTTGGGNGVPMAHFGEVVSLFDRINSVLREKGVNTKPNIVSPLAADILLMHFAPEPERPADATATPVDAITVQTGTYREPTDEEMAHDIANMFVNAAPEEVITIHEDDVQNVSVRPGSD